MDTKKTLYHTLQENPDAWLQAAVDAKEISDVERDTIQKFLDAPNKAEAARQMDIIRATMQDRPEFALSQEERAEIAQQVEELDEQRRQLAEDISQLRTRRYELTHTANRSPEEEQELQVISDSVEKKYAELADETRKYITYSLIQGLATSEQAQEQAHRWYEDIGREQGKNLFKALSEFSQSVQAQRRGDLEQAQLHRQKASVAFHGYNEALARDFERRAKSLKPTGEVLKRQNELGKDINAKIKTLQETEQRIRAKEMELVKAARAIATNQYEYRKQFSALSAWAHGKQIDTTFQEIKDYEQAKRFMQDNHRSDMVTPIETELKELQKLRTEQTAALQEAVNDCQVHLHGRQEAIKSFILEYEQAINSGYVDNARTKQIAQGLNEAHSWTFITDAKWLQTFKEFGINVADRYTQSNPATQEQDQEQDQEQEKAKTTQTHTPGEPEHTGTEGPAPVEPEHAPEGAATDKKAATPKSPVNAHGDWAAPIIATEEQHKTLAPAFAKYTTNTGHVQIMPLSTDLSVRKNELDFLARNGGRYEVLDAKQAEQYKKEVAERKKEQDQQRAEKRQARELGDRGKALLPYEQRKAWFDFVNTHAGPKQEIAIAVNFAEQAKSGLTAQDMLERIDALVQNGINTQTIDNAIEIAGTQLHNGVALDIQQHINAFREQNPGHEFPSGEEIGKLFAPEGHTGQDDQSGFDGQDVEGQDDHDFDIPGGR